MDGIVNTGKAAHDRFASFQSVKDWIDDLSVEGAARALAAAGDVALVLDREGVIRDVAVGARDLAAEGLGDLRRRKWVDTVASDSRAKVVEILEAAAAEDPAPPSRSSARAPKTAPRTVAANGAAEALRWREINQQTPDGGFVPIRFCAVRAGGPSGKVVAFGRDLRPASALQQKLLVAEQAMERDYTRLRQAENRYRLLFHAVGEAVLVVDATSRRILEANPASAALLGVEQSVLIGKPFSWFVSMESQEIAASALMAMGQPSGRSEPTVLQLAENRGGVQLFVSVFRQDRLTHLLLRLSPLTNGRTPAPSTPLSGVIEAMPDAFVVVNDDLSIVDSNAAFLDLAQIGDASRARGLSLSQVLGRSSVDLGVLMQTLREHGVARNFSTVVRTPFGAMEAVDVSAVAAPHEQRLLYGFSLRPATRAPADPRRDLESLPRSVEQLTDLIGRAPLREIVRETTDIIERLCVEAALKITGDNRASAAELLGLSRQSLYSKMNRYELGAGDGGED